MHAFVGENKVLQCEACSNLEPKPLELEGQLCESGNTPRVYLRVGLIYQSQPAGPN